jgi:hypothetical protein
MNHVALLSNTKQLSFAALSEIGAAIQKQVLRDFSPAWEIQATVDVFATQDQVPIDYWHVMVTDEIDDPTAEGYHRTDHGQPFALVAFDEDCSVNLSHEVLEMLADPCGSSLKAGDSVKPGQGRVQYLVEVCDPLQLSTYSVNEVRVCDFYTPHYFDPVAADGVSYSFTRAISKPRQVLKGGYLTFFDPVTQHWFQQRWFDGNAPEIVDVSQENNIGTASLRSLGKSPREMIDRVTPATRRIPRSKETKRKQSAGKDAGRTAAAANARIIREAMQQAISRKLA